MMSRLGRPRRDVPSGTYYVPFYFCPFVHYIWGLNSNFKWTFDTGFKSRIGIQNFNTSEIQILNHFCEIHISYTMGFWIKNVVFWIQILAERALGSATVSFEDHAALNT